MVVSHLLVSWIQVIGLVVSLMGFFYLSLGLFGKDGISYFRPLLPGVAAALLATSTFSLLGYRSADSPEWLVVLMAFFVGYTWSVMHDDAANPIYDNEEDVKRSINFAITMMRLLFLAGLVFIPLCVIAALISRQITSFVQVVGALAGWGMFMVLLFTPRSSRYLSERRLQVVGFTLSVLGILTQFIPPVLDILDIKVR